MRILTTILCISFCFSSELEVDGDLKVVGSVQIGTIDSLEQVILQQQQQISVLQALIIQLQAQITLLGQQAGLVDCNGVIGGNAVLDCVGVCQGDAMLDNCGTCDNNPDNDCGLDECGVWGGDNSTCLDECGVINGDGSSCLCIDYDGNIYETVLIGNQEWMAENLRTTTYNDGIPIERIEGYQEWQSTDMGAYSYFDMIFTESYGNTYGYLYNAYAARDEDVCPEGWRVPSNEDWIIMQIELGMSSGDSEIFGHFGYGEGVGNKLKVGGTAYWGNGNMGNNESGFSAKGSGMRLGSAYSSGWSDPTFSELNAAAYYWTSSEYENVNIRKKLYTYWEGIQTHWNGVSNNDGFSIRCVKN